MTPREPGDEEPRQPATVSPAPTVAPVPVAGDGTARRAGWWAELGARAEEHAHRSRASATWAAYDRCWTRFEAWCAAAGEPALPAEPGTVARFVADLAPVWRSATPADAPEAVVAGQVCERDGLRPGTLAGYVAAISVAHRAAGCPNPTSSEAVRATLAGIRRHPGVAPVTRRTAARAEDIAAILATMSPGESLVDARDTALLLLGWKAALRSADLVGMRIEDQQVTEEGLVVFLRRSKSDQTGTGVRIGIATHPSSQDSDAPLDTDGVSLDAAAAWSRWAGLLGAHGITTGPAWRAIDKYGARPRASGGLHRNSIRRIITARAAAAGIDVSGWGAHSLRRGLATEAIARGVPEHAVARHGRWRSRASMDVYIAEATLFDETNPTQWLD
jgi:integrase